MKSNYPTTSRSIQFNMTPIIDVVLLLIVFFLVSSHLARQETQLELALPAAESGREPRDDRSDRVTVNIDADGQVTLSGAAVSSGELRRRLEVQRERSGSQLEIRIRSDRTVPYRVVEPILLACARAGIWNVTFAVVKR